MNCSIDSRFHRPPCAPLTSMPIPEAEHRKRQACPPLALQYVYCHPNGLGVIGITRLHPLAKVQLAANGGPAAPSGRPEDQSPRQPNHGSVVGEPAGALEGDAAGGNPVVEFMRHKSGGEATEIKKRSGKKAKGGVQVQQETVICRVTLPGGRCFKLRAAVKGVLLELNERLVESPDLLSCR